MTPLTLLLILTAAPADALPADQTAVTGRVTAADGKPIPDATVWWIGPTPKGVDSPTGSRTRTDAAGRFRVVVQLTAPLPESGERLLDGAGFDVSADGFVRLQERLPLEEKVLPPAGGLTRDFVLAAGERIAGRVTEKVSDGFGCEVTVRGPSFRQVYQTDPDGSFAFWVPKGTYTLSAADYKSIGVSRMRGLWKSAAPDSVRVPTVVTGVVAGGPPVVIGE